MIGICRVLGSPCGAFFDAWFRNTIDRTRFYITTFVVRAEDVPRSFLPDLMPIPIQGDRFDHFGNGERVDTV
jgi:hypothetical protein